MAASEAAEACNAVRDAEIAMNAAGQALHEAEGRKETAYEQWEEAEQNENAEAVALGINPAPPVPERRVR